MELGARICSPKNPACLACPITKLCSGAGSGAPERFGAREKKGAVPEVYAGAALCVIGGAYVLARRPDAGLLGGLWELPAAELLAGEPSERAARRALREGAGVEVRSLSAEPVAAVEHIFTHRRLTVSLHVAESEAAPKGGTYPELALVPLGAAPDKPLPAVTKKALTALAKAGLLKLPGGFRRGQ
jgi:A/G-specific adenine glycosylase